jgi:branched-chain amino acid transport system ATP-binding protein
MWWKSTLAMSELTKNDAIGSKGMIAASGLVSGYGKVEIVRGVDIRIEKGQIVSLIGRNGVGKSTFMKTIMGSIRPMSGTIYINGIDFTSQPAYLRPIAGVGFVEQGHGIFPLLTVEENLRVGLTTKKAQRHGNLSIAYDYFPVLGERRFQNAGSLSGGERAMVSIARMLVGKPEIILLDEPSEGVQPNVVHQIGEIIMRSSKEMHLTILMVEQNVKLIQQVSERCYVMDKGRITGMLLREELVNDEIVQAFLRIS